MRLDERRLEVDASSDFAGDFLGDRVGGMMTITKSKELGEKTMADSKRTTFTTLIYTFFVVGEKIELTKVHKSKILSERVTSVFLTFLELRKSNGKRRDVTTKNVARFIQHTGKLIEYNSSKDMTAKPARFLQIILYILHQNPEYRGRDEKNYAFV